MPISILNLCLIFVIVAPLLLIGCSKSQAWTDRLTTTRVEPGDAVMFLVVTGSREKSLELEEKIVRYMTAEMKEGEEFEVLGSKHFCFDIVEPVCTCEDIVLLLQDAHFRKCLEAARIHYIVFIDVKELKGEWSKRSSGFGDGGALYYRKDTAHDMRAVIIDARAGEIAGTIGAIQSASSGFGLAGFAAGALVVPACIICIAPFGWYGGDTEEPAIEKLTVNVIRFLAEGEPLLIYLPAE